MKQYILLISFACVSFLLQGCESLNEEDDQELVIGMANPASVYCEKQKGTLDIRIDRNGGQTGICVFENGFECEEWALFKKDCKNGGVDMSLFRTEEEKECARRGGSKKDGGCMLPNGQEFVFQEIVNDTIKNKPDISILDNSILLETDKVKIMAQVPIIKNGELQKQVEEMIRGHIQDFRDKYDKEDINLLNGQKQEFQIEVKQFKSHSQWESILFREWTLTDEGKKWINSSFSFDKESGEILRLRDIDLKGILLKLIDKKGLMDWGSIFVVEKVGVRFFAPNSNENIFFLWEEINK